MSDLLVKVLKAGLILRGNEGKFIHLVTGDIRIPVLEETLIHSDELDGVIATMEQVVANNIDTELEHEWRLHIPYAGRCWVLEGGPLSKNGKVPALGYYEYPSKADWEVAGVKASDAISNT